MKQLAFSCNLLILFGGVLVNKKRLGLAIQKRHVWIAINLFAHVAFMSIAAGARNNTGRIFYFTAPILVFYMILASKELHTSGHWQMYGLQYGVTKIVSFTL